MKYKLQKLNFFFVFIFINVLSLSQALAQNSFDPKYKMNKAELKRCKQLTANCWESKNAIMHGKEVDINKQAGITTMCFVKAKITDEKSGKKFKVYQFQFKLGELSRSFYFQLKGKELIFKDAGDWAPMKIDALEKDRLSLDQRDIKWNMIPVKK
jgi:hypothetical protein